MLVAVMVVVSDSGEMWSPQTEPEKIAPKTGSKNGSDCMATGSASPDREVIIGTAIGIIIVKLPHADPVAMVQMSETIKNITGRSQSGTAPNKTEAKY